MLVGAKFATAQTTRDVGAPAPPVPVYQASKKETKKLNLFKGKEKSWHDVKVEEFEARMREINKANKKEEKMAQKPQYSDPLYFGHKKPPKKRPLGKRKFCKVCRMKH